MDNEQVRTQKNCAKLYRKLLNICDLIMKDEKYFKLTGNNVIGDCYFDSTPAKVNFQCKSKGDDLDGHVFQRCFSSQKRKQDLNQETYLKDQRLLSQVSFE